ncbi:uncharacterized protein PGTG_20895 [Puccinia graminis f. sp. tritici CRL 75-36-700-3]|uniref:Uncharacterized protein n=1 Tax=Puccinia graminis f. sp. tritici (strain CRL 75-36-700-3 / race SCCL) TaxID=418459 RepID=H6QPH7_PUCGT|nr:uncharacterized protein PGTG_20895 [Puccinia graminis f. sp. tritici CRL 75-36-700-3]EHS63915.1 hypothetical protein PGTG_20895 [Puccinia graminis f. sp. tritici CRL 75-36-700-3]
MIVDEEISQLEPVIDCNQDPSGANSEADNEKATDEEIDEIVPGTFEIEESEDDEEAEATWMDLVGVAVGQIDSEPPMDTLADSSPLFRREEEKIKKVSADNSAWYLFLSKEYLMGSLLVGYLHKLILRYSYHQIRVVFTLNSINLPRWEALRMMRAQIRSLVNQTVIEKETIFGQPVFGLKASDLIKNVSTHLMVLFLGKSQAESYA